VKLLLLVVPLGLDTFAVSAALGMRGLNARERLRISIILSCFEAAMPILGLLLGRALGTAVGTVGDYLAIGVLAAVGLWTLRADDDGERRRIDDLARGRGLAALALGLGVSVDELAMGFGIGLLRLPIWLAIVLIGAQAFVMAQLGLRAGSRAGRLAGEYAERAAGVALLAISLVLLLEQLAP
jgi:manganese efflux pump family protein